VLQYARNQPREGYHDQEIFLALRQGNLPRADRLLAARPPHADRGQRANRRLELRVRAERAMASRQTEVALDLFRHAAAERTPLYAIDWYEEPLADAYLRLGRSPEAINEYQRVLGIYPKLALAWYGLAKACQAAGQPGPARRAYQQMALLWQQADPDIIELSQARSFLAR
jgi:tetratricopeptide (TPR) repeat protein